MARGFRTTLAQDDGWRAFTRMRLISKLRESVGKHDLGKFLVKTI